MVTEKYFAELTRVLAQKEIRAAPPERGGLPVLLDGQSACHVDPIGGTVKFPADLRTVEANELSHRVASIAQTVREYMLAVEQAPPLKADELDGDFRLLAKFNGVALAAEEMGRGLGFNFITWEQSDDSQNLWQGHYFIDGYEKAKQDFAVRSGLVDRYRMLTDEQLREVYDCLLMRMEDSHGLTWKQQDVLWEITKNIEALLPGVYKKFGQAQTPQPQQGLNM